MARTTTWENLGVASSTNNLNSLLKESGLDYDAVPRDLYVDGGNGSQILVPNKKMIVREDTNELFGIVSDRYQICQNREALDFVQFIDGIELQKAGSLGGWVYLIAKLPEVNILGDTIRPNLIFQNSHDGSCSIRATICMLRIVCQNQFVRAFRESPATIKISHVGNMEEKVAIAQETFSQVHNYLNSYEGEAVEMAGKRVSSGAFNKILKNFFETKDEYSDRRNEMIEMDRDRFIKAYNEDDNQNFVGTQWGVVNAFSDYLTHYEPLRRTENYEVNRFYRSLSSSPLDSFIEFVKAA